MAPVLNRTADDVVSQEYWDEYDDSEDLTCLECGGSGADSWESFMPCEHCDGEGYKWWM